MSRQIRVATWNIYLGADLSLVLGDLTPAALDDARAEVLRQLEVTAFPRRAAAIARLLVREQVDLVGLQEVCSWRADDELMWDGAVELCAALEQLGEPYDVVATHPSFSGSAVAERGGRPVAMRLEGSNVILRRRSSSTRVEETSAGSFGTALTVSLMGSIDVTIERGWCAATCTVDGAAAPLTLVNTHTEAYDAGSRDRQRTELMTVLPADPQRAARVVVVGDFNATPDEIGMPGDLVDAWTAAGNDGAGPDAATCCQTADLTDPVSRLVDRIDYVWVRGLGVTDCVRIGADTDDRTQPSPDAGSADRPGNRLWPSDHAGLVATLSVD